jgi:hypothetical protein
MNSRTILLACLAAATLLAGGCAGSDPGYVTDPYGSDAGHPSLFYDDLSPYGRWFQGPYGWVWTPYGVGSGWRPYTLGRWAYTGAGWLWVSDEPWGWAPYHYGRWAYESPYGWLWVPGDVWAPSWVSWRYGGGYVGWAPLPPDVRWRGSDGLERDGSDLDRRIDRRAWSFVPERSFVETRLRSHVVPTSRVPALLERTRNLTRYRQVDGRPAETGFVPTLLERRVGRAIPRHDIVERPAGSRERSATVRGRSVEVYRPERERGVPRAIARQQELRDAMREREREEAEARRRGRRDRGTGQ